MLQPFFHLRINLTGIYITIRKMLKQLEKVILRILL